MIGRLADKKSFAYSMTLCFVSVGIGLLFVCFTTPQTRWLYLVYACLHAVGMAGINSGTINLIYDYVVPDERAVALGLKNAACGIVGFLAALVSGAVLAMIQKNGGLHMFDTVIYAQQVLALLSLVVIIGLIVYMRKVIEPMKRVEEDACVVEQNTPSA